MSSPTKDARDLRVGDIVRRTGPSAGWSWGRVERIRWIRKDATVRVYVRWLNGGFTHVWVLAEGERMALAPKGKL